MNNFTDFRKWAVLALLLLILCATGTTVLAQGAVGGQTPDCVVNFKLTAAGNSAELDNRGRFCSVWVLAYYNVGFSGLTVTLQAAPVDTGGVAGSWGTATGTFTGTHPQTTTSHVLIRFDGYHPYLRVNLSGLTGTGTVTGRLWGFRRTS